MTRVTGTLHHVLGNAEAITEVWVRSARARGHGGGWLMETSARTPITNAHLSLDITPGPAILVAVAEGQPLEHIEIIVPDTDSETLEHCITAAQGTSGQSAEVLDLLRQQIASDLRESTRAVTESREAANNAEASAQAAAGSASEAKQSAGAAGASASSAVSHAKRAGTHADTAGAHASAAESSAKTAGASATGAASSADNAKAEADRAADRATAAESSATEASTHADRAEGVVDSVSWDDDRLTVAGKTSPSLRGPKGDRGEPGESGASTWDAISGRPEAYPPEVHTHVMSDITDLPTVTTFYTKYTLAKRDQNGRMCVNPNNSPVYPEHVTPKKYVDDEVAEVRALVETRAVVRQVADPPSDYEPGVLYVIPE